MTEADQIVQDARDKISAYCMSSCDAHCCKRGNLKLNASDAKAFGEVGECRIKLNPCPRLDGSKCSIYDGRPSVCADFPVRVAQLGDRDVVTVGACDAIAEGIADEHLSKLEALDYEVFRRQL